MSVEVFLSLPVEDHGRHLLVHRPDDLRVVTAGEDDALLADLLVEVAVSVDLLIHVPLLGQDEEALVDGVLKLELDGLREHALAVLHPVSDAVRHLNRVVPSLCDGLDMRECDVIAVVDDELTYPGCEVMVACLDVVNVLLCCVGDVDLLLDGIWSLPELLIRSRECEFVDIWFVGSDVDAGLVSK